MVLLCYCHFSDRLLLRELKDCLIIFCTDVISAILICVTGQNLRLVYLHSLESLEVVKQMEVSGLVPLATFECVIATHSSLYPAILIIPVIFLLRSVQMLILGNSLCKGTKKKNC